MLAKDQNLITVSVPKCPLCNRMGEIRYTELKDGVWFAPGKWTYRACAQCEILWLDPRPAPESFRLVYPPEYMTHNESADLFLPKRGLLAKLRFQVKLEILRYVYGYPLGSSKLLTGFIGMVAAHVSGIKRWAGYTVRFLPARKGRLLDVGCGNGEFMLIMSDLGWEVQGVEPDNLAVSLARKAGLEIDERPIELAHLELNSFDAITLNHVIEHLTDPVETLKRISSALQPGGLLVSISPNPSSMLNRWFGGAWRGLEPPRHFVLFGPQALKNLAQRVGLCPTVWTTSRNSEWMARESIGLLKSGDVSVYRGRWLPRVIAWLCKILTMVQKDAGEEVVLLAVKES